MRIGVPILRGPLRGRLWSPFAGGKFGRVMGGTYEPDLTEIFRRRVVPGSVVFDIGAHIGYYTLLAATLLRGTGRVLAMEPNPRNLRHLTEHIAMNRLGNVEVISSAVCAREGMAAFAEGTGSGTGHLEEQGEMRVATTTVDALRKRSGLSPDFIKVDVEGAEVEVLTGAAATLRDHRPVIFLSTHGADHHARARELLAAHHYRCSRIGTDPTESELLCTPAELETVRS